MTVSEAKKILLKYRPERPRSTENRQLQKAIDVVFDSLNTYEEIFSNADITINLRDKSLYTGCFACSAHPSCVDAFQPHSVHCGAYNGGSNK